MQVGRVRDFLIDIRFANSRTSDDVELRPIEARFTSPVVLRLVGLGVRNAGLLDHRRGPWTWVSTVAAKKAIRRP